MFPKTLLSFCPSQPEQRACVEAVLQTQRAVAAALHVPVCAEVQELQLDAQGLARMEDVIFAHTISHVRAGLGAACLHGGTKGGKGGACVGWGCMGAQGTAGSPPARAIAKRAIACGEGSGCTRMPLPRWCAPTLRCHAFVAALTRYARPRAGHRAASRE